MLVLPVKPAVRYDLGHALGKWLDSDHHISFEPRNPLQFVLPKPDFRSEGCREDRLRLQALRNSISDALLKRISHKHALEDGVLDDLHEYHATLLAFEKRGFPTIDDNDSGIRITWKEAFEDHKQEEHSTLIWDRACVLFNIVALLTAQADCCDSTNRESCKQAVSYCQQGASLLRLLQQIVQPEDFTTVDMSEPMIGFWQKYLLAQAQNFIYRMASLSATPNHQTLSVLAQSAYDLYTEALTAAQDNRILTDVPDEDWAAVCKADAMLYAARAEYHQAVLHRVAHEYGREIARLKQCLSKVRACLEFCQSAAGTSYTLRESKAIEPVVHDRLVEIEKDNYKIYQDMVPDSCPKIDSKQLAKTTMVMPETMLNPKKPLFAFV